MSMMKAALGSPSFFAFVLRDGPAAEEALETGGDPAQAEEKEQDGGGGDAGGGVGMVGCEPGEGDGGEVFAG